MSEQKKGRIEKADPQGRRQAIKTVLAGGGIAATALALPKEWTKPIVESIVVPAHAQTSPVVTTTTAMMTTAATTTAAV